jgi:tetratricopeptide (TPR) repeat protein
MSQDYYSILGVDKQAPEREIKRAYYNLARDLHPDKAKSPEEARTNADRLATISQAYNTLKDPTKRAEYDSAGRPAATGSTKPAPKPASPAPSPAAAAPAAGQAPPPAKNPGATTVPGAPPPPAANQNNQSTKPGALSGSDMHAQRILVAQRAFVKGMDFWKNTDYKAALPFFQTAVDNDPESEPHYHMKLAICLMKSKKGFSKAVEAAEKACQMDSYNMEFKFALGEIYESAGVMSKAFEVYQDILKWEPENQKAKMKLNVLKQTAKGGGQGGDGILAKLLPSLFGKK